MYYRSDILQKYNKTVPQTWDDLLVDIQFLYDLPDSERDWNGDSIPDYAACIANAVEDVTYYWTFAVSAPYVQSHGTQQGLFFNTETFEPLVNTAAYRNALTILKKANDFGLNELIAGLVESRAMMLNGSCAFMLDWGDMSLLPKGTPYQDFIQPAPTPGSKSVLVGDALVPCTKASCPYGIMQPSGEIINFAPYASFGGWSGMIAGAIPDDRQTAAYDFFSWMSSPPISSLDVVNGATGFQPYRFSHLQEEVWLAANYSRKAIPGIVAGITNVISSPNVVLDLRIKGTIDYQHAVDINIQKYYNGSMSLDEVINAINDSWTVTTLANGLHNQTNLYRTTLGLPLLTFRHEVELPLGGRVAVIVLASISIGIIIFMIGVTIYWRQQSVLRRSSPNFIVLMMLSSIITLLGIIVWMTYPTRPTCTTALVLTLLGLPLTLSNLFARTARVWWIQRRSQKLKVAIMSDFQLLCFSSVVLVASLALIIVWCVIDTPSPTYMIQNLNHNEYMMICDSPHYGEQLFIAAFSLVGVMLGIGCILAWNTKDYKHINESKYLAIAVYNLTVVVIIVIAVVFAIEDLMVLQMFVAFVGIFACFSVVAIMVLPKFYAIYFNTLDNNQAEGSTPDSSKHTTEYASGDISSEPHTLDLRDLEQAGTQFYTTTQGLRIEVIFT